MAAHLARGFPDNPWRRAQAVFEALLVHALVGAALMVGLRATPLVIEPQLAIPIEATVVDMEAIRQAQAEAEAAEQAAAREAARQRQLERQREAEAERAAEAERERVRERRAAEERAQAEQAARIAAEREAQQRREAERRALEEQRREAEAQRRREEAELARIEAERQALAAQRERELEEQRLQQLRDREAAAQAQAAQASLRAQYIATIQALVTQNWRRPPTARSGLRCLVRVNQLPGGSVTDAVITGDCSADPITQRSIVDAVLRSAPLPYRGFENVFERQITFEFVYQDQ